MNYELLKLREFEMPLNSLPAIVLVLVLASRLLRGIPIISGHPELDSGL